MDKLSNQKINCRVCLGQSLDKVLSLGATPPANAFLAKSELGRPEHFFPLELFLCHDCGFVGLGEIVSPDLLFRDYVYVSSTSPSFVQHFEEFADYIIGRFSLPIDSLIVDIGSNDGIMLRPFQQKGWRVLGVDPARKIAEAATRSGIETWPEFFTTSLAEQGVKTKGQAQLVTMTSAFPHIDDLDEVIVGTKAMLAADGVFVIEAYYLLDLFEKNLFDTVYHEHLSYFTVTTLERLLARAGLQLLDVEHTDTHGGSLRAFVQQVNGGRPVNQDRLNDFKRQEEQRGLGDRLTFAMFENNIKKNRRDLLGLLTGLKSENKKIAGYGAAAKGNTLLNYFGIDTDTVDYIVDDSPWKQGLYTPGTHIPVVSSAEMERERPDYVLILAWNFAEPIMAKLVDYKKNGGKFIIPVPEPKIL